MSNNRDLADYGYRRTESDCHRDGCDGRLWYDNHTLVCAECHSVIDMDRQRRNVSLRDPIEVYREEDEPPRYNNSGRVRLPGGFPVYEWTTSDDIDGTISDLDAGTFYRS